MRTAAVLALAGIGATLAGSTLLAVSLNTLLTELTTTVNAHDLTIRELADSTSDIHVFTGLDVHVERGEASARRRTVLGILLVGLGSVLQAIAVILSLQSE